MMKICSLVISRGDGIIGLLSYDETGSGGIVPYNPSVTVCFFLHFRGGQRGDLAVPSYIFLVKLVVSGDSIEVERELLGRYERSGISGTVEESSCLFVVSLKVVGVIVSSSSQSISE